MKFYLSGGLYCEKCGKKLDKLYCPQCQKNQDEWVSLDDKILHDKKATKHKKYGKYGGTKG